MGVAPKVVNLNLLLNMRREFGYVHRIAGYLRGITMDEPKDSEESWLEKEKRTYRWFVWIPMSLAVLWLLTGKVIAIGWWPDDLAGLGLFVIYVVPLLAALGSTIVTLWGFCLLNCAIQARARKADLGAEIGLGALPLILAIAFLWLLI